MDNENRYNKLNNFLKDTDNNQDLHALKGYNFIKKTLNF